MKQWQEKKRDILAKANWQCSYTGCKERATELAHRIANTEYNAKRIQRYLREKYEKYHSLEFVKKYYLNNELNLAASCRMHNDYFNCANNENFYKIVDIIVAKEDRRCIMKS